MGFSVPGQNTQNTAPRSAPVATSRAGSYAPTMTSQQDATLAPAMPSEPIKYEAGGQEIELSPELIKSYLVSGDADKVNDQEVMMFLNLCRYNHLNPWLKEVYLIKYGDKPATMVPGKEAFMKRAERNPHFTGIECGIVVHNTSTGQIEYREGSAVYEEFGEKLIGGWAKVYRDDRQFPNYSECALAEYIGRKSNGDVNQQWSVKPATMIRKVAAMQAMREAFPNDLGAMYSAEEQGVQEPDGMMANVQQTEPTFSRRQRKPKAPTRPDVEIIDATPNDEADPLAALENAAHESDTREVEK